MIRNNNASRITWDCAAGSETPDCTVYMRCNRSRPRRNCRSSASSASSGSRTPAAPDRPCGSACRPFCASSRRSLEFYRAKDPCTRASPRSAAIIAREPCCSSLSLNASYAAMHTIRTLKTTDPVRNYRRAFKPRNRPGYSTPATSTSIHNNVSRCQLIELTNVAVDLGTFRAERISTDDFIGRPTGNTTDVSRTHENAPGDAPPFSSGHNSNRLSLSLS